MRNLKVNLCVREPKTYINYYTSSFTVENAVNFPIMIVEEVKNLSKPERRQLKLITKSFLMTAGSFLTLTSRSMANTLQPVPTGQIALGGIPKELFQPLIEILGTALGVSLALAVLLFIAAGILRMLRKKKEATEWTTDIIKGFIQILIAIPLIFLLYYAATLILGNFTSFLNPF